MKKLSIGFGLLAVTVLLGGCQTLDGFGQALLGHSAPTDEQYVNTDDPRRLGLEHFERGDYGLAERYFQAAVERVPQDGDSWMGLAASYDQLGRFDLADRAYDQAARIEGNTPRLLNNRGYSYLLRGDAAHADRLFHQALSASPGNPTITNNLVILKRTSDMR